jgi:hypothetical protein
MLFPVFCQENLLILRPYLDKKSPRVQVGAKQAVSPPGIFFSGMLKKQVVDLG